MSAAPCYRHSGKARRGDGNDVTPNPSKLYAAGKELRKLARLINAMCPPGELPTTIRARTLREKNKYASRICRLKKKAQHEANKIQLYGLEHEHRMYMLHRCEQCGAVYSVIDSRINKILSVMSGFGCLWRWWLVVSRDISMQLVLLLHSLAASLVCQVLHDWPAQLSHFSDVFSLPLFSSLPPPLQSTLFPPVHPLPSSPPSSLQSTLSPPVHPLPSSLFVMNCCKIPGKGLRGLVSVKAICKLADERGSATERKPGSGRPNIARTEENVRYLKLLISENQTLTLMLRHFTKH